MPRQAQDDPVLWWLKRVIIVAGTVYWFLQLYNAVISVMSLFPSNERPQSVALAPVMPLLPDVTVARDGSGDFRTISEAVDAAPINSAKRFRIHIKMGTYEEVVRVGEDKTNLVFTGDGADNTVITGNRTAADGWPTEETATLRVEGDGFVAINLTIQNAAGLPKGIIMAVALSCKAENAAFHQCRFYGYLGTLHAGKKTQFYKDCVIVGSHWVIHGDAKAIFQTCEIHVRAPIPGQRKNALTGQGRRYRTSKTGFSFLGCSVTKAPDYGTLPSPKAVFLGEPLGPAARVVFIKSYIDGIISPERWIGGGSSTTPPGRRKAMIYYGEYLNYGPGAGTSERAEAGTGFRAIGTASEAFQFTVQPFIDGDEWLPETGVPFQTGLPSP